MTDANENFTEDSSFTFVTGFAALYPEAVDELIELGGAEVVAAIESAAREIVDQFAGAGKPITADYLYCMVLGHNMTKGAYDTADALAVQIAVGDGALTMEQVDARVDVELYESGQAVLDANLPHIESMTPEAVTTANKLAEKFAKHGVDGFAWADEEKENAND